MNLMPLLKDLFALIVIFGVNCLAAIATIFFIGMRAPQHDIQWSEFFQLDALSLQLILGITAVFWLSYLFYFKKKM